MSKTLTAALADDHYCILDSKGITLLNTVYDDLRVPATATKTGGSKIPDFIKIADNGSGSQGVFSYAFDDATEEEVYFFVQLSHKWKIGTTIFPHVHWMPVSPGGAGETVSWGLEYTMADAGSVFANSSIIYGNTTNIAETLVQKKQYITSIGSGIDMATITGVSPMLACRLFRDAAGTGLTDSYADDAALLEFDFHYEIDALGSDEKYTK